MGVFSKCWLAIITMFIIGPPFSLLLVLFVTSLPAVAPVPRMRDVNFVNSHVYLNRDRYNDSMKIVSVNTVLALKKTPSYAVQRPQTHSLHYCSPLENAPFVTSQMKAFRFWRHLHCYWYETKMTMNRCGHFEVVRSSIFPWAMLLACAIEKWLETWYRFDS